MANFASVTSKLMTIIDSQEHKKLRGLHYELEMRPPQLKRYIADIALTLDMHPANLGIESEETGKFFVGTEIVFKVRLCRNLFKSAMAGTKAEVEGTDFEFQTDDGYLTPQAIMNPNICQPVRYPTMREHTIPHRVVKIMTNNCPLRAVIVVEHRNVALGIEYWKDNLHGCLIVMVTIPYVSLVSLTNDL